MLRCWKSGCGAAVPTASLFAFQIWVILANNKAASHANLPHTINLFLQTVDCVNPLHRVKAGPRNLSSLTSTGNIFKQQLLEPSRILLLR
ncbi:uncharacterized protein LAJ45_04943 [Morchella importuna]|uniref:uncharacterized protein n=1 Tax=Morchella importuna TaxID=1174673 RepID=UPI001E8DA66B|nr:uncharacterized protein LAJ45_04943 [Morchella importuna]KAH8150764.1 hypothetical protein LAJ45_04943 [Morchella importuna]